MLNPDVIREATRLTRAGRLVEATALLQRMLRGERAPDAPSRPGSRIALADRAPLTIDAKANAVGETDSRQRSEPATAQPRMLGALLERTKGCPGIGLRGAIKRAPSRSDIVPDGARFIEGTYSNPNGSRSYKLFVPSRYQERPLPLVVMLHGCTQSPDDFAAGTRMNFIAEEQNCFVVYPAQPRRANQSKSGTGFVQPTSSEAGANLRLSRALLVKSSTTFWLTQDASILEGCRPEAPLPPSWEQPTTIYTLRSEYTRASRAELLPIFPPRLP